MANDRRMVMSKRLSFHVRRGTLGQATEWVNQLCAQTPTVREVDFKKLIKGAFEQAAAELHHGKDKWLIVVEEDIVIDNNSRKSSHIHHQFKHFSSDDFDKLAQMVNHFCSSHEVTKLQVKWHDPAEGQWTVICRYAEEM